jgi:DNA-binding LacI/PurR family transcriptional regulator
MARVRHPFDPNLIQAVSADFFSEPRKPGDLFWSVRDICTRFGVTKYCATLVIRSLVKKGVLRSHNRKGTFLAEHPNLRVSPADQVRMHPAFVWPGWGHDEIHGSLAEDTVNAITSFSRKNQLQTSFFDASHTWQDRGFPARFRSSGCNVLLALDPPLEALLVFMELRLGNVPIVVMGSNTEVHKGIGVITVQTDEREVASRLTLALRNKGLSRFLVLGETSQTGKSLRYQGIEEALDRYDHAKVGEIYIDSRDQDYQARVLAARLRQRKPPDALIFHSYLDFLTILKKVAPLYELIRKGLTVAVFDDGRLDHHVPDLRIIRVVVEGSEMGETAMKLATRALSGASTPAETLVRRKILFP